MKAYRGNPKSPRLIGVFPLRFATVFHPYEADPAPRLLVFTNRQGCKGPVYVPSIEIFQRMERAALPGEPLSLRLVHSREALDALIEDLRDEGCAGCFYVNIEQEDIPFVSWSALTAVDPVQN
jgi:hypothetical protein